MRRIMLAALLVVLMLAAAPLAAQDATPVSTPAPVTEADLAARMNEMNAIGTQIAMELDRVERSASETQRGVDHAFNLLGIFEAIGFFVTVAAGLGGILGIFQLFSARAEMTRTRDELVKEAQALRQSFESEIKQREEELRKMERQLETYAAEQSDYTQQALLANALIPLGERQYKTGDYVGALNTYLRALELAPDNPVVNQRLGYVYTQRGDLELAKKHYEDAIARENNFAAALAGLGFVYRRFGEKMEKTILSDAALNEADRMKKLVERDLLFNRAEEMLLKALSISPRLVDDDGESWWGVVGGLYKRRGQIDQAVQAYDQVTKVTPESSYGYGNLALLYMKKNDRDRMLDTYVRVEKIAARETAAETGNFWGYADLIVSRYALGMAKAAEEVLPMAEALAPVDSPYMLEALAETLEDLLNVLQEERKPAIRAAAARLREVLEERRRQKESQTSP